ncbi:hypothetical protein ACEUAF_19455 [Aeromonas veronii]
MSDSNKVAHLGFIQSIISRMASNSFAIKGWSVSLTAAIIAAGIALKSFWIVATALIPIGLFIFLDSYFFLQEKKYREFYNTVRMESFDEDNPFNLSLPKQPKVKSKKEWFKAKMNRLSELKERAVYPIYLTQLILVALVFLIMA